MVLRNPHLLNVNSGPVFNHDGQNYEWVQEIFYAIVCAIVGLSVMKNMF